MSGVLGQDLFAEVVQRLRAASQEERAFDAAQMHLINLPEVIARAGAQWPKLKDKLRASSVGFLKGCLSEQDIVIPAGDGFLVIFAEGETDGLKAQAEELRSLLLEFYLGQDELKGLGIEVEHRVIDSTEIAAMLAPPPKPPADPSAITPIFAPIWSSGPQVIASYFCLPMQAGDEPFYGYDRAFAAEGRNEFRDYVEADIKLLDAVEAALSRYGPDDARPAIGAPVHSTTLMYRNSRAAYLDRLGRFPPLLTKHIYIRIAEIEPGTPTINLADWAGMLRARVRNMMLEFHHTEPTPPDLSQVGVLGAGYRAPPAASGEGADIIPHVRHLRRWGDSLGRQRQRFFIDDLKRPGLVRLAAEAGAHFITSDAVWPYQQWPGGVISAPAPSAPPFPGAKKTLASPAR